MAFTCGFFNSIEHDRVYASEDFGQMFDGLITDGVYPSIGHCFAVVPGSGLNVKVRSGRAWFNRTWSYNSTDYTLSLGTSDYLLPRIDAIVLEVDLRVETRYNCLRVIPGAAETNPKRPTLNKGNGVYQYPLAFVTIRANATDIKGADIANAVGNITPFTAGILKSVSIEELWAQWDDEFYTWLRKLKTSLEGNVALEHQRLIELLQDDKLDKSALATQAEAQAGTANNKWMSPLRVQEHFNSKQATNGEVANLSNVNKYITPSQIANIPATAFLGILGSNIRTIFLSSGSSWTPPSQVVGKMIYVTIIGAGGGGGGGQSCTDKEPNDVPAHYVYHAGDGGGGGGAGQTVICAFLIKDTSAISYTIGRGGGAGGGGVYQEPSGNPQGGAHAANGENTIFNGITATGGEGGKGGGRNDYTYHLGRSGGAFGINGRGSQPYKNGVIALYDSSGYGELAEYIIRGMHAWSNNATQEGAIFRRTSGGVANLGGSMASYGEGGSNTSPVSSSDRYGFGGGGGGSAYQKGGDGGVCGSYSALNGENGEAGAFGSGGGGGGGGCSVNNLVGNGGKGGPGGSGLIIIQYQG